MARFELTSDRQSAGSESCEAHRITRVTTDQRGTESAVVIAVFRRRDIAEDFCGQLLRWPQLQRAA